MKVIKIFLLCLLGVFTFNLSTSTYKMYKLNKTCESEDVQQEYQCERNKRYLRYSLKKVNK